MNKLIREFEKESGLEIFGLGAKRVKWEDAMEKFTMMIVKECAKLNKKQSYELLGVIVDTEDHDGFDDICLDTVKRVAEYLERDTLIDHFGKK
jgi:hypothetical protein